MANARYAGLGGAGRLRLETSRYGVVLAMILASLVFQLAAPDHDWARVVTIGLQGVTLLAALAVSHTHRWVLRAAAVIVSLALLASAGTLIGSGSLGPTAGRAVNLLLVSMAPLAIGRGVIVEIRAKGVTVHTMFGVLCIYLLLGSVFAFLYGIAGEAQGSFFAQSGAASTQHNFLYFSFVTITTTGYGDLTAATNLGRSLAITEALIGQIYLVTIVAAIVGGLRGRRA